MDPTVQSISYFAQKYAGSSSADCRDRGLHARGVYPTQDTSRMGTARARVKQEEEADIKIIARKEEAALEEVRAIEKT